MPPPLPLADVMVEDAEGKESRRSDIPRHLRKGWMALVVIALQQLPELSDGEDRVHIHGVNMVGIMLDPEVELGKLGQEGAQHARLIHPHQQGSESDRLANDFPKQRAGPGIASEGVVDPGKLLFDLLLRKVVDLHCKAPRLLENPKQAKRFLEIFLASDRQTPLHDLDPSPRQVLSREQLPFLSAEFSPGFFCNQVQRRRMTVIALEERLDSEELFGILHPQPRRDFPLIFEKELILPAAGQPVQFIAHRPDKGNRLPDAAE